MSEWTTDEPQGAGWYWLKVNRFGTVLKGIFYQSPEGVVTDLIGGPSTPPEGEPKGVTFYQRIPEPA